jgi:hypothetical protein
MTQQLILPNILLRFEIQIFVRQFETFYSQQTNDKRLKLKANNAEAAFHLHAANAICTLMHRRGVELNYKPGPSS